MFEWQPHPDILYMQKLHNTEMNNSVFKKKSRKQKKLFNTKYRLASCLGK